MLGFKTSFYQKDPLRNQIGKPQRGRSYFIYDCTLEFRGADKCFWSGGQVVFWALQARASLSQRLTFATVW